MVAPQVETVREVCQEELTDVMTRVDVCRGWTFTSAQDVKIILTIVMDMGRNSRKRIGLCTISHDYVNMNYFPARNKVHAYVRISSCLDNCQPRNQR
jgi:hypothetical protein